MERWFEFMGNHPFLFGILFVLIVLFFMIETKRGGKKINPNTVGLMVNNDNAQIIDVRPKKDFEKGYIKGSHNVPFTDLKDHIDSLKQDSRPLIIVCQMGMMAGTVVAMIGKENVYRLDGGIANWQASGLPLVSEKVVKK
ncbi:rhodanese-like domain-containing protein [Faucicola boevrei]|uniref:rhodanese-like domain-containing protein n=1 Tax=Faucicola boevrei TaxID=346665 RepID=UPI000366D74A|nr:rhodanese-like domain-containing protein [Moraxella boevrei]